MARVRVIPWPNENVEQMVRLTPSWQHPMQAGALLGGKDYSNGTLWNVLLEGGKLNWTMKYEVSTEASEEPLNTINERISI